MLAYSNGANDNFKGVVTLFGSGLTSYKRALIWTSVFTLLGVVCSSFFAETLIKSFSGKGLVPDEVVNSELFIASVSLATALTIMLATRFGMPVSTTHGLVGALVGSGLMAASGMVDFSQLGKTFLLPLLLSPVIAGVFGWVFTYLFGIGHKSVDERNTKASVIIHYTTSGAVCFSRGLNDAPKIAGMLVITHLSDMRYGILAIGAFMVVGGWMHSRRIADTMGTKMAKITVHQGMIASATTAVMVVFASLFGSPVSTTHVSVGSIYGSSLVSKTQDNSVFRAILMSWILTLPIALIISLITYFCLNLVIQA